MMGSFTCPNCGQSYHLTEQVAQKSVKCMRCETVFQAPAVQPGAASSPAPLPSADPSTGQTMNPVWDELRGGAAAATGKPLAPGIRWRSRGMNDTDRVLLGVGAALATFALLCVLILFSTLGGTSIGVAALVVVLGVGGAGLIAFALRRRMPVACGVAASVIALLLLGAVLSTKAGADKLSNSGSVSGGGTLAETVPSADAQTNRPLTSQIAAALSSTTQRGDASPTVVPGTDAASQTPTLPRTELIGGSQDGEPFELQVTDPTIIHIGHSRTEGGGFNNICPVERPKKGGFEHFYPLAFVDARDGYALGGINVDSGSEFFHAAQFVFVRVRPDGSLDPNDSYCSDWIGQPVGPIQRVRTSGARVIGFYGHKKTFIQTIGLVLEGAGTAIIAAGPPVAQPAPALTPRSKRTSSGPLSSLFGKRLSHSLRSPSPKPPVQAAQAAKPALPVDTTPPAELPKVVRDALDSVVLVEHPLASGSGFAVAENIVATNAHVVEGAFPDEIMVRHGDENNAPQRISRILYIDRARDLCLLEGEMTLKPLPVRSDYVLRSGDSAVLMGNPSVKGGILMRNATNHGKLRTLVHIEGQDLYHIDADVNPGWSGGPVVDSNGKVIAIVVMKAGDAVAEEIRGAMRRLDDGFRKAAPDTSADRGITYGIPGSALAKILKDATLRDTRRQASLNDKYAAQVLVGRLRILTGLSMIRMQVNVPLQVRMEADAFAQGRLASRNRFSSVRVEYIPLMPEEVAMAFHSLLRSDEVKKMEGHFTRDMNARIGALAESPHVAPEIVRDVKALKGKIKEAAAYAEEPGISYTAFSLKFSGFSRDFRQIFARLNEKLGSEER